MLRPARHLIESLFALALTPACGAEVTGGHLAATDGAAAALTEAADIDADADADAVDEADEVQLPPATVNKVRRSFRRLRSHGGLPENKWRLGEAPPQGARYGHVSLDSDYDRGIYDGYAFEALVAVRDDGAPADKFYLVRAGGIAGWQFLAGPFNVAERGTAVIGESYAGRTVTVPRGDQIAVELRGAPRAGYSWYAAAGPLGQPSQVVMGATDRVRLTFSPDAAHLHAGTVYPVHLMFRRASEQRPARDFTVFVQVH